MRKEIFFREKPGDVGPARGGDVERARRRGIKIYRLRRSVVAFGRASNVFWQVGHAIAAWLKFAAKTLIRTTTHLNNTC
jgi:hypothetical protein